MLPAGASLGTLARCPYPERCSLSFYIFNDVPWDKVDISKATDDVGERVEIFYTEESLPTAQKQSKSTKDQMLVKPMKTTGECDGKRIAIDRWQTRRH
jgi:hypothetical protein